MKHILIICLILFGFSCHAEWVRGTILLNDGQLKTGYIRDFTNEDATVIEFKLKTKDDPTSIMSNDVAQLQMRLKEGTLIAKYLFPSSIGINGEFKKAKNKIWLRVVFRGDFDVMGSYSELLNESDYFVNWPGEDSATRIYIQEHNGAIATDKATLLKKSVSAIFEMKCDAMVMAVNEKSLVPLSINDILKYYVENCKKSDELQAVTN